MNGAIALKAIIVLGAFPVIVHAIFTGITMLLGAALPLVFELTGGWPALLGKGLTVASFLVALRCSYGVCRRLWPAGA